MKRDLYVGESKIAGKGVFTKRSFKRGKIIFILKGAPKKKRINGSRDSAVGPNWVGIQKNTWIDPDGIYQYLNHSCDPNMGIKGSVTFVAIKNIKAHEELVFDYSTTEDDIWWSFNTCKCGTRKCRKVLKSIQFLPKNYYDRYYPFIPNYFQKIYNKSHK